MNTSEPAITQARLHDRRARRLVGKTSAYRVLADALSKLHKEYPGRSEVDGRRALCDESQSVTMGQ